MPRNWLLEKNSTKLMNNLVGKMFNKNRPKEAQEVFITISLKLEAAPRCIRDEDGERSTFKC